MSVTIRLEGSAELQTALRRASQDIRDRASAVVMDTAFELRGDVVNSILRGPKTGRIYTHYYYRNKNGKLVQGRKRSKPHQSSRAGEAPANDEGRLAGSIEFDKLGDLTAIVGTEVKYGYYLEYGTVNMAARPFFRPAIEEIRPKYIGRLEKLLRDTLR